MSEQVPLRWQWDGEAMRPTSSVWARKADERYVVGEEYRLTEIYDRSPETHRHYFAVIKDAWMSLPDELAARFETPEHLRKYAVIKAGYHEKKSIHCASIVEARKVAAFMRPLDTYAIVTTQDNVVTVWTAQSQDHRHMDKATFQRSKEAVLDIISNLLGTDATTLNQQGANA